ncbi:MAG: hypothetical protein PHQ95_03455 [Candidatus Gracilibacteria bacterium]|nr:hypothetical protein [Candidatus Gracilibacteria bacterium]
MLRTIDYRMIESELYKQYFQVGRRMLSFLDLFETLCEMEIYHITSDIAIPISKDISEGLNFKIKELLGTELRSSEGLQSLINGFFGTSTLKITNDHNTSIGFSISNRGVAYFRKANDPLIKIQISYILKKIFGEDFDQKIFKLELSQSQHLGIKKIEELLEKSIKKFNDDEFKGYEFRGKLEEFLSKNKPLFP